MQCVGCADKGGASFANDGLRKLSPKAITKRDGVCNPVAYVWIILLWVVWAVLA